jgi:hypothetical protein
VAAPIASPVFAETKPAGAREPLTILINAAPVGGRGTAVIPDSDAWILSDAASTLLRELGGGPARVLPSVLPVREMLRLDAACPEQANVIARAVAAAPQTTVIIGPPTQSRDAIPEGSLPAFEGRMFVLEFVPIARREISGVRPAILYPHTCEAPGYITPMTRDPVKEVVSRAHGRTMTVASPAELAHAMREIRKR